MLRKILVPDVGEATDIEVVELLVAEGDTIEVDGSLLVLESDKASMEIPSPFSGRVTSIAVSEGDRVEEGTLIVEVETVEAETVEAENEAATVRETPPETPPKKAEAPAPAEATPAPAEAAPVTSAEQNPVHAGPAVRKQAREYGVPLSQVPGTGQKGRILPEDIRSYVKTRLNDAGEAGSAIPPVPVVDFAKFGDIEKVPFSRVRKASARNLHRSWLNIPHVTQFDEADITALEAFRREQNELLRAQGVKLTPLAFLIKALVAALQKYPGFNASLSGDGEQLIHKKYHHIGIAVETDDGLVVPVLKDADRKGVVELAQTSAELAARARDGKLPMDAMQGATFTISSLGGIGGTAFTPIVNAPEVAILGVSRARVTPVWKDGQFEPRTILPLSLSYDHRAIDGAEAARFTAYLSRLLGDLRHIIL